MHTLQQLLSGKILQKVMFYVYQQNVSNKYGINKSVNDHTINSEDRSLNLKIVLQYSLYIHEKDSGSWLNVVSSPFLGSILDNSTFGIPIVLRVDQPLRTSYECNCGEAVNILGRCVSCHHCHQKMNDIIKRSVAQ